MKPITQKLCFSTVVHLNFSKIIPCALMKKQGREMKYNKGRPEKENEVRVPVLIYIKWIRSAAVY